MPEPLLYQLAWSDRHDGRLVAPNRVHACVTMHACVCVRMCVCLRRPQRVERVARDLPNVECCLNCSSKFNKMVHGEGRAGHGQRG